jgi:hypothetical protein
VEDWISNNIRRQSMSMFIFSLCVSCLESTYTSFQHKKII